MFRDESPDRIIKRECSLCDETHQEIFYKRISDPDTTSIYGLMSDWVSIDNVLGVDFNLYSTLEDALTDTNAWTSCNYDDPDIGAFRDCGPNGVVSCQWTARAASGRISDTCGEDAKFYIYTGMYTQLQIMMINFSYLDLVFDLMFYKIRTK